MDVRGMWNVEVVELGGLGCGWRLVRGQEDVGLAAEFSLSHVT
jgi:hypothetical protein